MIVEDNVVGFPAPRQRRRAVGAHRLLQPAGAAGPRAAAGVLRAIPRTTARAGRRSAPSTAGRTPTCTPSSTSSASSAGRRPLPDLEFIHESPWLNLYVYPRGGRLPALAAARRRPGTAWSSCVRRPTRRSSCPTQLAGGDGRLVYLSLGSLGSADVELMRGWSTSSRDTPHRFIVSKGPQHDEYELADNMWGEEYLPQPAILPAGRPRDHPRRQQHDHRVPPLRQADGRAAALLGPVRQRPARRRDRFGSGSPTYAFAADELRGASTGLLGDARCGRLERGGPSSARPMGEHAGLPELIEQVAIVRRPCVDFRAVHRR